MQKSYKKIKTESIAAKVNKEVDRLLTNNKIDEEKLRSFVDKRIKTASTKENNRTNIQRKKSLGATKKVVGGAQPGLKNNGGSTKKNFKTNFKTHNKTLQYNKQKPKNHVPGKKRVRFTGKIFKSNKKQKV